MGQDVSKGCGEKEKTSTKRRKSSRSGSKEEGRKRAEDTAQSGQPDPWEEPPPPPGPGRPPSDPLGPAAGGAQGYGGPSIPTGPPDGAPVPGLPTPPSGPGRTPVGVDFDLSTFQSTGDDYVPPASGYGGAGETDYTPGYRDPTEDVWGSIPPPPRRASPPAQSAAAYYRMPPAPGACGSNAPPPGAGYPLQTPQQQHQPELQQGSNAGQPWGAATLRVRILAAYNLMNLDTGLYGDLSDPYVVAKVGKVVHKTPCIDNDLNPVWDEGNEFAFQLDQGAGSLELEVFNSNIVKDASLGRTGVPLWQLVPGQLLRRRQKLDATGSGELEFEVLLNQGFDTGPLGNKAKQQSELVYQLGTPTQQPRAWAMPLEGVHVLELTRRTWSAALCGSLLARSGADVVRVAFGEEVHSARRKCGQVATMTEEASEKTAERARPSLVPRKLHSGKRLAPHHVDDPKELALLKAELLPGCDLLITDLPADELDRMQLGHNAVRQQHPGLIVVNVSSVGALADLQQRGVEDAGAFYCLTGFAERLGHHLGPTGFAAATAASALFGMACLAVMRRRCGSRGDRAELNIFRAGRWCMAFGAMTGWARPPEPDRRFNKEQDSNAEAPALPFDLEGAAHLPPSASGQNASKLEPLHLRWRTTEAPLRMPTPSQSPVSSELPLARISVIEISDEYHISAAAIGSMLADLGARVTKIERPQRPDPWIRTCPELYKELNSKKKIKVMNYTDLGGPTKNGEILDGQAAVYRALANTTIFITNLPLLALESWGYDVPRLRTMFPHLIIVQVSTWGIDPAGRARELQEGRKGGQEVHAFWEASGLSRKCFANAAMPPGLGELAIAQHALGGIGLALLRQQRSGTGQLVHIGRYQAGLYSRSVSEVEPLAPLSSPLLELQDGRFVRLLARGGRPHDVWMLLQAIGKRGSLWEKGGKTREGVQKVLAKYTPDQIRKDREELVQSARTWTFDELCQAFHKQGIDWFAEELRPVDAEAVHKKRASEADELRARYQDAVERALQEREKGEMLEVSVRDSKAHEHTSIHEEYERQVAEAQERQRKQEEAQRRAFLLHQQYAQGIPPDLTVTVQRAQGLHSVSKGERPDSYCVVQVMDKAFSSFHTPEIRENGNPEWQHCQCLNGFNFGEPVIFAVYNKDPDPPEVKATPDEQHTSMLYINVLRAYNLKNMDTGLMGDVSDPYVVVKVGSVKQKTPVISNDLNPVWNEENNFSFRVPDFGTVHFQVFNKNYMKDDNLGTFEIEDMRTFQRETWQQFRVPLKDSEGAELEFEAFFKPAEPCKPHQHTDELLGKAQLEAQAFYPNGFEGPLRLALAAHDTGSALWVSVQCEPAGTAANAMAAAQASAAGSVRGSDRDRGQTPPNVPQGHSNVTMPDRGVSQPGLSSGMYGQSGPYGQQPGGQAGNARGPGSATGSATGGPNMQTSRNVAPLGRQLSRTGSSQGMGSAVNPTQSTSGSWATLQVRVTKATNLKNLDTGIMGDYSDPYVLVRIGSQEHKTPTINNDLNPVWKKGNLFEFRLKEQDTLMHLKVMNSNTFKDQPLGRVEFDLMRLPIGQLAPCKERLIDGDDGEIEFEVLLQPRDAPGMMMQGDGGQFARQTSAVNPMQSGASLNRGQSNVSALQTKASHIGQLQVRVNRAYNLKNLDTGLMGDVSDPYVLVRLGSQKQKTPTISNNLDPIWKKDNQFDFRVYEQDTSLQLEVMNDNIMKDTSLGSVKIDLTCVPPGQWFSSRERLEDGEGGELEFELQLNWKDMNQLMMQSESRSDGGPVGSPVGPSPAGSGGLAGQYNSRGSGGLNPMQGGVNPMQGGINPMQGGINPMQGGINPMQGGINPMQGGVNPMQGGSFNLMQGGVNPMQGGVNPMQGGLSPMQTGYSSMPGGPYPGQGGFNGMQGGLNPMQGGYNSAQGMQRGFSMQNSFSTLPGSMQGGMQGGVNPMQGPMQGGFGFGPIAPIAKLHVRVIRAGGLQNLDSGMMGGASNPFVLVRLGREKRKTPVLNKSVNPVWEKHNIFELDVMPQETLLSLEVLSANTFHDDSLGLVELDLSRLPPGQPVPLREPLRGGTGELELELFLQPLDPPAPQQLQLPKEGAQLQVRVKRAYDLKNLDTGLMGDVSDPYVMVRLGNQKQKTPTINNNLNPRWERQNLFDFKVTDKDKAVYLQVMNSNTFQDQSLGTVEIELSRLPPGQLVQFREPLKGSKGELEFEMQLQLPDPSMQQQTSQQPSDGRSQMGGGYPGSYPMGTPYPSGQPGGLLASLQGTWAIDGGNSATVDMQGTVLYNGKHMGTSNDLIERGGMVQRGDGWVLDVQRSTPVMAVFTKQGEGSIQWYRQGQGPGQPWGGPGGQPAGQLGMGQQMMGSQLGAQSPLPGGQLGQPGAFGGAPFPVGGPGVPPMGMPGAPPNFQTPNFQPPQQQDQGPVSTLHVRVCGARNLINKDTGLFGDVSDPYVSVSLGNTEFKTPTIDNNLNPVWNSGNEFAFNVDLQDAILNFKVMNSNVMKDSDLGTASLDLRTIQLGQWCHFREKLEKGGQGELEFDVYLQLTEYHRLIMEYTSLLYVRVNGALQLRNMDTGILGDVSDPYVVVRLGEGQEQRTGVIMNNLNPVWEDGNQFTFHAKDEDAELVLQVMNSNYRKDDLLGTAKVQLHEITPNKWTSYQEKLEGGEGGQVEFDVYFKPTEHYRLKGDLRRAKDNEVKLGAEAAKLGKEVQLAEYAVKWLEDVTGNTKLPLSVEERDWEHACGGRNLIIPAWIAVTSEQIDALRLRKAPAPVALFPDAAITEGKRVHLKVKMLSAEGLSSTTLGDMPNAYCTCEIPLKPKSKIRSPPVLGSSNPEWNYTHSVREYTPGDALILEVSSMDDEEAHQFLSGEDRKARRPYRTGELLGKAWLKGDQLYPNGFDGLLSLYLGSRNTEAVLRIMALVEERD